MNYASVLRKAEKLCLYMIKLVSIFLNGIYGRNKVVYTSYLEKKKINCFTVLNIKPFDKLDPINYGIISDESVENIHGAPCRRVTYRCSITGNTFVFLTNLPYSIRPGLIALLYKYRWSVEKGL
jgi:hypothetical protein